MPRRKPKKSMEMMPGRMMASDNRKYQLRRPTMSIYPITSCGLRRLDAVEREPARRPQPGQDLQDWWGVTIAGKILNSTPMASVNAKPLISCAPEKEKKKDGMNVGNFEVR